MNEYAIGSKQSGRMLVLAVVFAALGAGLAIGAWIRGSSVSLEDIDATVLEPPGRIEAFSLVAHTGSPFTDESLKGKWTFMFFGYTHCPDICPATMGVLTQMDKLLLERNAGVERQVVFVSVDPERDTVEKLGQYVPYFDPTYIGVTGERDDIDRFTGGLGILHVRAGEEGADDYLVNHSSSILLFDPDGGLRALFSGLPHDPAGLAENFLKIVRVSDHG